MSTSPLVSAVIPTYNRPDRLQRAAKSVIRQTYDRIELVVIDDHSPTPARSIISDLETDELVDVRVLRHERNRGGSAARNTGIEAARGVFVAFLDDDDRWLPDKIDRQVSAFSDGSETLGVVYTGRTVVEGEDETTIIPPTISGDFTKSILCDNVVGTTSVVMARRNLLDQVGGFDEAFPSWQELELYVRLSTVADFSLIPESLVRYDTTAGNRVSDDYERVKRGYELYIAKHGPLARDYGRLFHRKMLAWAAFRVGRNAVGNGYLTTGRQHLFRAVTYYPFNWQFIKYFLSVLGGRPTYRLAWSIRNALSRDR